MAKDLYEILGLKKDAAEPDIKRAYRKMAMEWHPDKHKGDKTAEDKFKEITMMVELPYLIYFGTVMVMVLKG
jgi:DnaJ-class molecular chaperone